MVRMSRIRGWAVAAAAGIVIAGLGLAGCGSGHGAGAQGGSGSSTAASTAGATGGTDPAPAPTPMSAEQAYAEYQHTMGPGCTTVDDCQTLMTARMRAVHDLRTAMRAENPARYADAIADVDRADRVATQYRPDQLGAAGNMMAVMQPIQDAITAYASIR